MFIFVHASMCHLLPGRRSAAMVLHRLRFEYMCCPHTFRVLHVGPKAVSAHTSQRNTNCLCPNCLGCKSKQSYGSNIPFRLSIAIIVTHTGWILSISSKSGIYPVENVGQRANDRTHPHTHPQPPPIVPIVSVPPTEMASCTPTPVTPTHTQVIPLLAR